MKLKAISSSVLLALLPVSGVYAAAMDRSGQSISAFRGGPTCLNN